MTGENEAELERIRSTADWRIPKADALRHSLTSLDNTMKAILESSAWEGSAAEGAKALVDQLRSQFRVVGENVERISSVIERANEVRREAVSSELPSAQIDPFWDNAVRGASHVVHPVLGPLAADTALDVIGRFLGNQREEAAKAVVQKVHSDLQEPEAELRKASAALVAVQADVAEPQKGDPGVTPGTRGTTPGGGYPGVPGGGGPGYPGTPGGGPGYPGIPGGGPGGPGVPGGPTGPGHQPPVGPVPLDPTYPEYPTDPGVDYPGGGPGGEYPGGNPGGEVPGRDPSVDGPGGGTTPTLPGIPGGPGGIGGPGGGGLLPGGPGAGPGGMLPGGSNPSVGGVIGGGAGAAAIAAGSKIAGAGSLGGLGGVGGMGGAGGLGAAGGGLKAGGGLLGSTALSGGGAGGAGGAGSATGSGASGASGARPGMMMGGQGAGSEEEKAKRSGLGGPIAPKLEDEDEVGPRAKGARAGSRDDRSS